MVLHHLAHYLPITVRGFPASNNRRFITHKLAPLILLRNNIYTLNIHTRASTILSNVAALLLKKTYWPQNTSWKSHMICLKRSLDTGENRPVTKEGIRRCLTIRISRICNNSHNFHNVHTCLFVPMQNETSIWINSMGKISITFNYLQNTSIKG